MSKTAGQLLWRRIRIESIPVSVEGGTDIDTGLTQVNKSFDASSVDEPPLGVTSLSAPIPGTLPASRVHVIPLAPLDKWFGITHSEPYFNPATGTVHVTFFNQGERGTVSNLNVLFWDPHTSIGPGQADTYDYAIL